MPKGYPLDLPADFWGKVRKTKGCWIWCGYVGNRGYGELHTYRASPPQKVVIAHRYSWELTNGPIPAGLFCLHSCDNKLCVKPAHLFIGTQADNMQDASKKGLLRQPPETCWRRKLTAKQVKTIRTRYASGKWLYRQLAAQYGVTHQQIGYIVRRLCWK